MPGPARLVRDLDHAIAGPRLQVGRPGAVVAGRRDDPTGPRTGAAPLWISRRRSTSGGRCAIAARPTAGAAAAASPAREAAPGARSAPVVREAAPSALADTLLVAARADAIVDIWVIGEFGWFGRRLDGAAWIQLPRPQARSVRLLRFCCRVLSRARPRTAAISPRLVAAERRPDLEVVGGDDAGRHVTGGGATRPVA